MAQWIQDLLRIHLGGRKFPRYTTECTDRQIQCRDLRHHALLCTVKKSLVHYSTWHSNQSTSTCGCIFIYLNLSKQVACHIVGNQLLRLMITIPAGETDNIRYFSHTNITFVYGAITTVDVCDGFHSNAKRNAYLCASYQLQNEKND